MDVRKNKELVFAQVAEAARQANRSKDAVTIIAVTKYVDTSTVRKLIECGVEHIGENRVDKFLEKYQDLKDEPLTWHLIGTLQRRKVKDVIHLVDYFHALDSLKLAREINKRADHVIKCFLQVNISKETSKHGFAIEELEEVLEELAELERVQIVGLMTMAPLGADETELNAIFQQANQLRQDLQKKQLANMPFTDLSMGMTTDYQVAIKNGTTFVRIGTAFFK